MRWGWLGPLRLHLLSVVGLRSSQNWSFAEHPVAGRPPVLQDLGPDLRRPELTLRWDAAWCAPSAELAALRALAAGRRPHLLQLASGRPIGRFVVAGLEETHGWTDGQGRAFRIEARASLIETVGPGPSPRLTVAVPGLPVTLDLPAGGLGGAAGAGGGDPDAVPAGIILRME